MKYIFCLTFLFCTTQAFTQKEYSIQLIPKELLENANSVVIDELVEVDVTNIAKMKTKKRRVVAVLNRLGNNDVSLREYYDDNSKVKNIEVRIYDANGKQISRFRKRDFIDVSRTGISMYSDDRMLYLNYTPTSYPYIVVFESETESGDSAFIWPWLPIGGYAESTQKSVHRIKYDPANKPRYKAQNLDGYNISIEETPNEINFYAEDIRAIRYEEHSPVGLKIFPHIRMGLERFYLKGIQGSAANWKELGLWMEKDLLEDVREIPEGTIARVRNLVANETTNEGKARKIYQYVQDKVRYISIQIGIGGWKPMPATEVDKLSYGDCKALTNYTKALLDAVGVPSYYTILYGDSNKWDIIEDFVSMQGNHVILGIPDGDEITWLECTSQDTPYGYIAEFTDDRDVLIMTPEGGKIVHTKVYETEENTQENFGTVKIDAKGSIKANFKGISKGIKYGDKYLVANKKPDEVDRFYKSRWSHINGFSLIDPKFINDQKEIVFTETLQLDIPNYSNSVGNDYLFCPNIFNRNNHIPPRISDRKQKLYIGHGYIDIDRVEVEIPSGFSLGALPVPTVLETKFGNYEIAFTQTEDNKVQYVRKLRIEKGEYPPSEYENYREFLRTISRLDQTKILLKQNVQ